MIIHLLHLKGMSILDQLHLEEKLLREDDRNFCILNEGSTPAIVMGISGKPKELIDLSKAAHLEIPVIKRFSGGGTVVVDEDTLFATFLCNKKEFSFPSYPERIMKWTGSFYEDALKVPGFALKEHDFAIENLKCGGNAQYIKKERWLQHTSFLWDFCPSNMQTLLMPRKIPKYRDGRGHEDFLCTLNSYLSSKEEFFKRIKDTLSQKFEVIPVDISEIQKQSQSRVQTATLDLSSL